MEERVDVREVGLRDGLQLIGEILPVHRKIEWIRGALAAGVRHLEVTSFVPARVVPQFADAEEVVREAIAIPGLQASVLVPNLRGAERAFAAGAPRINYVISASEMHNQANVRRSTDESLTDFRRIAEARKKTGQHCEVIAGGIATAFGCTLQGAVSEARVIDIAEQLAAAGADEILLADTVGYADPYQVSRLTKAVRVAVTPLPVACHFHDTRALGLANVVAALEAGVRAFDASIGGLGGCPFAPGATGNIDMEDTVFLLEQLGFKTGFDLERLIALRREVETWLPGQCFSGAVAKAGLPKTYRGLTRAAA
jgi:hydroxymethylglutaryl-CoA lyase